MDWRVLIDELMKMTLKYDLFPSFTAKASFTSGQRQRLLQRTSTNKT
jgi:hypothetical protein